MAQKMTNSKYEQENARRYIYKEKKTTQFTESIRKQ